MIDAERLGAYVCSYVDENSMFHVNAGTRLMFSEFSTDIYSDIEKCNNIESLLSLVKRIKYLRPDNKLVENW